VCERRVARRRGARAKRSVRVNLMAMALTGLFCDAAIQAHRRVREGDLATAWCQR
jgi:hypothetical protein